MTSPQAAAVEELRAGLLAKFGTSPTAQDAVTREIATFVTSKRRINIQDLNQLESAIVKEIGAPSRRRRISTHRSVAQYQVQERPERTVTPQPTHTAQMSFIEPLGNQAPAVGTIVQVTSGKRRGPTASPTMIFPRIEGSPGNFRVSPDASRNLSPLDYGHSEELRFRGTERRRKHWDSRREDSWGCVLKWDSAKFAAEEEAKRIEKGRIKRQYKEELDRQLRERSSPREESTPEATSLIVGEQRKRGGKTADARKRGTDTGVVAGKEKFRYFLQEKTLERKLLDEVIDRDKQEKAAVASSRKATLLSLKAFQMRTAAERLQEKKARAAESRAQARVLLEQERLYHAEQERKEAEAKSALLRKVSEENRSKAYQPKAKQKENVTVGDFNLAEAEEMRIVAAKELQARTAAVLSLQVLEQQDRRKERQQLLSDQADIWSEDKALYDTQLAALADKKKRMQLELSTRYKEQVEDREQRKRAECSFSTAEAQINKAIIEAASPFK